MSDSEMSEEVRQLLSGVWAEREQRTAALGFDLLPCPFCGSEHPYVEYNDEFDVEFVQCDCGASYAGDDLAGWNSRVDSPRQGKH